MLLVAAAASVAADEATTATAEDDGLEWGPCPEFMPDGCAIAVLQGDRADANADVKPGTYAYGPPELPHTAECTSDEACVLFIAFEEPVDAFATECAAGLRGTPRRRGRPIIRPQRSSATCRCR